MDQERFDALTKRLATSQMRRSMVRTLGATALGALGLRHMDGFAKEGKVSICHRNDLGTYNYITVAQSAVASHMAHGDVVTNLADTGNCGDCGNACTAPANGTATCVEGSCGYECAEGYQPNADGTCATSTPQDPLCAALDCKAGLGDNDCTTTECLVIEYFGVPTARCYNDIYELHGQPCSQGGPGICSAGTCFH